VSNAQVLPNYQGIGLPQRFWIQVVQYLRQSSSDVGNTMVCDSTDGMCTLPTACENYSELWNLSFKIESESLGGSNPQIYAPLALFANNTADGTCSLFLQIANSTDSNPSTVFLGSMFLQGFVAAWHYDYRST